MIYRYLQAIIVAVALVACGGTVDPSGASGAGGSGGQVADAGADVELDAALCGDGSACTSESGVKCPDGSTCTGGSCLDGVCVAAKLIRTAAAPATCLDCSAPTCAIEQSQRCPGSQTLWDSFMSCIRTPEGPAGGCANECANWLARYDLCEQTAASDPYCTTGFMDESACFGCWYGSPSPPYNGPGCADANEACSIDREGCTSCKAYEQGGNIDAICQSFTNSPTAAQAAAGDLSACACSGPCGKACAASCVDFHGVVYLETQIPLTGSCRLCLHRVNGCLSQWSTCAGF